MVHDIPPYPMVRESLEKLVDKTDVMVISSTPLHALEREWTENGIDRYVRLIAGQEYGSKKDHIATAAKGKYDDNKILMLGDAPGDMKAAKSNGALFFPIIPGQEEASWEKFFREGIDMFLKGEFEGTYEENLIKEFELRLPERPPWQ